MTQNMVCMAYGQLSKIKKNQRKSVIIFLSISLNMCFGCSKEPPHWDGSFEYPQHMFWLRNKKKNSLHPLFWAGMAGIGSFETLKSMWNASQLFSW